MVKLTIEKTDDFQAVRCSIKQEQHISSYTQTVFTTTRFTSNQKKKKKKKKSIEGYKEAHCDLCRTVI